MQLFEKTNRTVKFQYIYSMLSSWDANFIFANLSYSRKIYFMNENKTKFFEMSSIIHLIKIIFFRIVSFKYIARYDASYALTIKFVITV